MPQKGKIPAEEKVRIAEDIYPGRYYNKHRYQRRLFTLTPMEVYTQLMAA